MATPESVRRNSRSRSGPRAQADLGMTDSDWYELRSALANVFDSDMAAGDILGRIGFPNGQRPRDWSANSEQAWIQVFTLLEKGLIQFPQRNLLSAAVDVYRYNNTFRSLAIRYGLISPDADESAGGNRETTGEFTATEVMVGEDSEPPAGQRRRSRERSAGVAQEATHDEPEPAPPTCHVIVRAGSEADRAAAAAVLVGLGLEPRDVWATAYATSFEVNSGDAAAVRGRLDDTDMSWVVVPAGANDYLIRELYVSGPDGRRFRLLDAPSQQTVADVAAGIMAQYGPSFAGQSRPTVVDRVQPDGQGERLAPEQTLHSAGVRDGASLRMGFEATAGAVNPLDHQDALRRMRNQILHFARSRPDMTVRAAPPTLPTQYEISFAQQSFGPPSQQDGPPTEVTHHVIRIQFRTDFPETPPLVFWESPIFHPNIYPMYDSELARRRPLSKGLVCLGRIALSYTPSLSFGELCQTLIDMAAYRNYTVAAPTGVIAADGTEVLSDDYYDPLAARWARDHQAEIKAIGGSPMLRRGTVTKPYANAIEAAD
jgi:hypothetical protein